MKLEDLKGRIRNIPDFPIKGVIFRDITTLISDPEAFKFTIDHLHDRYKDNKPDLIVGIESRGFIFGGALADRLNIGFIPARKPGKLPWKTVEESYELEYGKAALQIHSDAINKGQRILILDDLLATGGTIGATVKLVERLGGIIEEIAIIIELTFLKGRDKLQGKNIHSLVRYDSE
ncbi:MAG: adenine phosphoribosyltransferase [Candidatus Zixiibacteriota bacterium]|nr:MAG: adenine phosphoribosyltransferase [candidate division Zixibacteria bacterium]